MKFHIAALLALFLSSVAIAQDQTYSFDIPAQELGTALRTFARVSRQQVAFENSAVADKRSTALKGNYAAQDALERLLSGSGLPLRKGPSGLFIVGDATAAAAGTPVSRAESEPPVRDTEPVLLEEITVTGSHIRGVTEIAAPVFVTTREDIQKSGYANLEEFFDSLPQNFSEVSADSYRGSNTGVTSQINIDRATGISLRGLGTESTLTLLNGHRLAGAVDGRVVDVSVIPLSAIERVETVTGGASAVYGADAVAGVVNMVTRKPQDVLETQLVLGKAEHGGERTLIGQTAGMQGERGGIFAAYEFRKEKVLDLLATGLASNPTITGNRFTSKGLLPNNEQHSLFLSGDFKAREGLRLYANSLVAARDIEDEQRFTRLAGGRENFDAYDMSSRHYSVMLGADVDVAESWTLDVALNGSRFDMRRNFRSFISLPTFELSNPIRNDSEVTLLGGSAVLNGTLMSLGDHDVRLAAGTEFRRESLDTVAELFRLNSITIRSIDRDIRSAFGEVLIPAFNGPAGKPLVELSAAGRFDDYSDFGSAVNPSFGVLIRPLEDLRLKATYTEAFRVPALSDVVSTYTLAVRQLVDPRSPTGLTHVFIPFGGNADLDPEEAKSWTFSVELSPAALPGFNATASYFSVDYQGRIDLPASNFVDENVVLTRIAEYAPVLTLNPTGDQIRDLIRDSTTFTNATNVAFNPATDDPLTAFPGAVIFDNRRNNIATERVKGIDGQLSYELPLGPGQLRSELNATYTFSHERALTETSAPVDRLNDLGKPTDFRARGRFSWSTRMFDTVLAANYVDGYGNSLATVSPTIGSWTTVDFGLGLRTAEWLDGGPLDDVQAYFSVQNLFGRDPPRIADPGTGLLYDTTNANALGRFLYVRFAKQW